MYRELSEIYPNYFSPHLIFTPAVKYTTSSKILENLVEICPEFQFRNINYRGFRSFTSAVCIDMQHILSTRFNTKGTCAREQRAANAASFCVRPCFRIYRFHFAACHPHAISTVQLVSFHRETACRKFHTNYDIFYTPSNFLDRLRSTDFTKTCIASKNVRDSIRIIRNK